MTLRVATLSIVAEHLTDGARAQEKKKKKKGMKRVAAR